LSLADLTKQFITSDIYPRHQNKKILGLHKDKINSWKPRIHLSKKVSRNSENITHVHAVQRATFM
jgi:hypothetical protein